MLPLPARLLLRNDTCHELRYVTAVLGVRGGGGGDGGCVCVCAAVIRYRCVGGEGCGGGGRWGGGACVCACVGGCVCVVRPFWQSMHDLQGLARQDTD